MKLPSPRGFAPTSSSAAVCDHVAAFSTRGRRPVELPEPLDLADFYGLPVNPYVRATTARAPIACEGTHTVGRDEKKIPMSFSPPRWKNTKNGPREVKWILRLETVQVTITVPRGSFTLTATNRGGTVHDSRDDSRRPLPAFRADLRRILGDKADAAAAELESVLAAPRQPAPKFREVSAEEKVRAAALRDERLAADLAAQEKRRERKANPPAVPKEPDFANMTPRAFTAFNRKRLKEVAAELESLSGSNRITVEASAERPAIHDFPAPWDH